MIKYWRQYRFGMAFAFAVVSFLTITATVMLSGFMIGIFIQFHDLPPDPRGIIGQFMIISVLLGIMCSTVVSRVVLRPIRRLKDSMNKLATGDFSVRIDLTGRLHPREFFEFTNSFNHMAEELGSIEMLRSDFVNNFSHEFKTPIVSMKGFAEVLKNKNLPEERREEYLDIIIQESKRLADLTTNVLNLSKIEKQSILMGREEIDFTEHVRNVLLVLEPGWSEKGLHLDIVLQEIRFACNPDLMDQMLLNVIGNAIKFSHQGGELSIRLEDFSESIIIKVQDRGCGMSEETQKHIYDKFYQGDSSHVGQGNGLGMSLVQKIISLHNGDISIDSRPDHGALITIALPKIYSQND